MVTVDQAQPAGSVIRRRRVPHRAVSPTAKLVLACLGITAGARLVTSAFLLWLTTQTTAASEAGAAPTFAGLSSVWDGRWYHRIAFHGYPSLLPLDAHGQVQQNPWAFLPAYPALTRVLADVSGLPWDVVAVAVSMAFGAAAAVLLAVLLRPHVGVRSALFAVALFASSPVAFVLQTAYADAMMTCLLFAALCLLDRRRYAAAIPVVLLASFTRPGVLAFALTCGLHLVARRRELTGPGLRWLPGVALFTASTAGGLAWPAVVAVATGDPTGYLETETAWRAQWMGPQDFTVFQPWLFAAQQVFGVAGVPILGLVIGVVAFLVVRPLRRTGAVVRAWTASWVLYLLAVFMPQTSLPRLLIPMAPALGALPVPRRPLVVALVLAGTTAVQLLWLWCTYGPIKTFLTVP